MKEKIFILVKTYPTLSAQYDETVCTAGVRENGEWVRIYPVRFRLLKDYERYKKYQWINVDLQRNTSDPRIESHRPVSGFELLSAVGTNDKWAERREILSAVPVYSDMQEIINKAQKKLPEQQLSLAMFKPTKVLGFTWEKDSREWDKKKLHMLKTRMAQTDFFEDVQNQFNVVKKLPYKFYYEFLDAKRKRSRMMIEDWEIGMLFWNCLKRHGEESIALQKVRQKYLNAFCSSSLEFHLILGTTLQFHSWASNPFVVVGVYCPPAIKSEPLI